MDADGIRSNTATIHPSTTIGHATRIWDHALLRKDSSVGNRCVIGRYAHVGEGVLIGDDCKVQDGALIFGPAQIADGVFIGPGAILTNDKNPRAVSPDGTIKGTDDWKAAAVRVARGASIGAGAICVAPVSIGAWAMVAAGAVVVADVMPYQMVAGNPARSIGWVGPSGHRLVPQYSGRWTCPATGEAYTLLPSGLQEIDKDAGGAP